MRPRILYTVTILLCSLTTLTLGLASGLVSLIVLRMAVGCFEVPTVLINNRIATTCFGEKERATMHRLQAHTESNSSLIRESSAESHAFHHLV